MLDIGALAVSTTRISMPYAAGALGGTVSERGGVVNISLEGLILSGAFAFVATSWYLQQRVFPGTPPAGHYIYWLAPVCGLIAAVLSGLILSLIHAFATVVLKADNIISGFAINIFALGTTNFLLKRIWNSSSNSENCLTFGNLQVFDSDSRLGLINQVLHPLILLSLLLFAFMHFVFYRTRFGLRLRAVGENPNAADSLGINVGNYRMAGVLIGGMIASLGGVWLASDQGLFTSNMSAGRGYIALAAMILGKWRPWGAAIACLVFGLTEALQHQLQIVRQVAKNLEPDALTWAYKLASVVPSQLIQALPYILTLIVIAGLVGRSTPPAAVGVPYEKEQA